MNGVNTNFFFYTLKSSDVDGQQVLSLDLPLNELGKFAEHGHIHIIAELIERGRSSALAELTPQTIVPIAANDGGRTVGEFLAEVERTSNLKPKTFRRYAQYFRMLAAQIQGVKSDASRYDYYNGGLTRWRGKVDTIPLDAITPAAVADWKIAYLKRAGSDPRRKLEVNRSFNAALRSCKSLFTPHIINKANFGIKIPRFKVLDGQRGEREAYWYETLEFERAGSMKFHAPAGVTYETLVTNARKELRSQHPEAYKLFLLCLGAGLRRAEADVCLWTQLNPEDCSIRIESNEYIEPKHGSGGTVYVDLRRGVSTTIGVVFDPQIAVMIHLYD